EICIYAFYICYGTGRVLGGEDRKRFISLFCALWTLAMVVYACIGLYTAFTGIEVPNLGNRPFTLPANEKRLWPVYHPVEAGTLAALSIAVALIGFFMTKRKVLRWLYFPAMFAIFLLNVFCASRTSYILSAMAIGIVSAMLLYETLQQWKKQGKGFKLLRLGVSFAAFAALTFLLIFVQMRAIPVFNSLKSQDLISTAAAEETVEGSAESTASEMSDPAEESTEADGNRLVTRAFVSDEGIDGFLTGRWQIWIHCCSGISHYPIYALIGAGVHDPMHHINYYIRYGLGLQYIYHFHSTFIQTLWESGIPGFLLFTVFFGSVFPGQCLNLTVIAA
ncbi:MAG: O-antigen ligase family protein, partial [Parasporobacterium sp.]|nr:O-antigen ligase family protein [Parasporobacterium sp.]